MNARIEDKAIQGKLYLEEIFKVLKSTPIMAEMDFFSKFSQNLKLPLVHCMEINETHDVYRTRIIKANKEDITKVSTFSYCPRELSLKGKPTIGRFNKTGQSIFYASLHPQTNLFEIQKDDLTNCYAYVSKWSVNKGEHIYCYDMCSSNHIHDEMYDMRYIELTNHNLVNGCVGDYLRSIGELCLKDNFKDKRNYYISSLFANHVYNAISDDGLLYEGIIYPSVALGNGNLLTMNFALTPECVDNKLSFQWVYKTIVSDDLKNLIPIEIGFYIGNTIRWFNIDCLKDMNFSNIRYKAKDDRTNIREIFKYKVDYMKKNGCPLKLSDFIKVMDFLKDGIGYTYSQSELV